MESFLNTLEVSKRATTHVTLNLSVFFFFLRQNQSWLSKNQTKAGYLTPSLFSLLEVSSILGSLYSRESLNKNET